MALSLGRKAMVAALATTTLMVAGCATETRYRPATGQGFNRQGYSERMIEPGRFLVSFAGNSVTSRDTVERYLFYRAAELTLQQGFDYFVMADRDTNLQSRTFSTPGIGGPWGYGGFGGYWGPSWRYHGGGYRHNEDTDIDRERFLEFSTVLLAALSFIGVVFVALPALTIWDCR